MFRVLLLNFFTGQKAKPTTVQYDREVLTRLYQDQAESIYRYFRTRIINPTDAEDLTSLVFRKAMESWANYQPSQSAAAWLFGIARYTLIDYYRSNKRPAKQSDSLEDAPEMVAADLTPEEMALQQEEARLLREAIRQLPPQQAEIITLRFVAQLSYSEIAESLGKKEPAVRMLIHRGLENLRKALVAQIEVS